MNSKSSESSTTSLKYNFNDKDWPTPGEAVETTATNVNDIDNSAQNVKPTQKKNTGESDPTIASTPVTSSSSSSSTTTTKTTTTTTTTTAAAATANTTTQGAKKGSKNKWRPLELEPVTSNSDDRRHGQRLSRNHRKELINNNNHASDSSTEVPNGGSTSGKKHDNNMLQSLSNNKNNAASVPTSSDKGFRGGRRGRGRGRGSGASIQSNPGSNSIVTNPGIRSVGSSHRARMITGRSNRNYDSDRITPNHEDFPADIAYYVDYSPISVAAIATEGEIDIGLISPTISPTPPAVVPAAFVTPAIVPTTTTFVPTPAFFSPYAATVTTASLADPNLLKKSIKAQVEYYFSEENLQRDFFLRRKMDEEGFLPISLIASFHRVKSLTTELALVIDSLRGSDKVEFSEDGTKLRTTLDPLKWPIFDQKQPQI